MPGGVVAITDREGEEDSKNVVVAAMLAERDTRCNVIVRLSLEKASSTLLIY